MKPDRTPSRRRPWLWGLMLLTLALAAAHARAQDPKLLLADSPDTTEKPREGGVLLRPNTEQTVHVLVNNPGAGERTVTVVLRAPGARSGVLRSKPLMLAAGATEPVVWDVPAAAPVPTPAPPPGTPPAAPAPAGLELKSPNRGYQLVLLDGKKEVGQSRAVKLLRPSDYLEETQCSVTFDGKKGQLTAKVVAGTDFTGPPAPVRLVLDPARIPGLVEGEAREGTYQRALTEKGKSVELTANRLVFVDQPQNPAGLVTLDVDGYDRAMTWRTPFNTNSSNNQGSLIADHPLVRIKADRYRRAGPKFPVTLLIDNVRRDLKVEVALDRNGDGSYDDDEKRILPTAREQRVEVRSGGDGALTFVTTSRDWTIDLDVAGLFGDVTVQVRLLDEKGDPVDLIDEAAALDPDPPKRKAVFQSVSFDSSNPVVEAFGVVGFPAAKGKPNQLLRGKPLTLYVRADDESGIKDVAFFIGRPTAEGALTGIETVAGVPAPKDTKTADKAPTWLAQLPVPTDKPAKVPVGVQVTNGAGMKSFGTLTIELVDAPKVEVKTPTGPKGTIEGTVTENGRVQPNVSVVLRDAQNQIRDTTKTDARGKYEFKDIPPGSYRVQASKTTAGTQGEASVQLLDGQIKVVPIAIKRP
jgi:hypothetical protein